MRTRRTSRWIRPLLFVLVAPATLAAPPSGRLSPPADAQGTARGVLPAFDALDANSDSRLGRDEVAANTVLAAAFDAHDHDNDGTLSRSEYDDYVALAASSDSDTE